jgi:hypothetical protein
MLPPEVQKQVLQKLGRVLGQRLTAPPAKTEVANDQK